MRGKPEANTETIQVVVRCRPKNSNETNSPVIVGCNKSSVDIKQTIGDKQQTKTFNFDKVPVAHAHPGDAFVFDLFSFL